MQSGEDDEAAVRACLETSSLDSDALDRIFGGVTISRCRDGKIVEEWELCDMPGLLRQIGALPA